MLARFIFATVITAVGICAEAAASVTVFTNKAAWEAAAQEYSTITFTEFPAPTQITDQYRDHFGVKFLGWNFIHYAPSLFPNDDHGLRTVQHPMHILFDGPHYSLAIEHPSRYRITLYYEGDLFYTSPPTGLNPGFFSGFVSTLPFNEVIISYHPFPENNSVAIDDLHFGAFIPAPGAIGLFGLIALALRRRRRSGGPV